MNCLCATTRKAARQITRVYEEALRSAGLTPSQFELLSILQAQPGLTQRAVGETLAIDQTGLSRSLKLLIEHNWVKRIAGPNDRREVRYSLTSEGQRTWNLALPQWQAAQTKMRIALGMDWETTLAAIERLSRLLSEGT